MSLPELLRRSAEQQVRSLCAARNRDETGDGSLVVPVAESDGYSLYAQKEGRRRPVARVRYLDELGQWALLQADDEGHWRPCLSIGPQLNLSRLLRFLDEDPFRLFWG